jgi:Tol biopolymer transport system component
VKKVIIVLLIVACGIGISSSPVSAVMESTFDTGDEGWWIYGDGTNLTHHTSGGNPGGFISVDDQALDETWWFVSPETWAGDWTSYEGGVISFDLKLISGDPSNYYSSFDVIIDTEDIGHYAAWSSGINPQPGIWTHFEVQLSESNFEITGDKTWDEIMSNVTWLLIRGEHISGPDTEGVDNIRVVDVCECDINDDGSCNGLDWLKFYPDWGRSDCNDPETESCECDLNEDGSCNGLDWLVFYPDWGRSDCPPPQLTTHPAGDGAPAWNPNNSKIAFSSHRSGPWSIWVMNTDGTGKLQLTDNLGDEGQPHWRADSAKLVFYSNRSGNWDIWKMDSDGSNLMQLTDDPADDIMPDFSPDGSTIIFESNRSGNDDIWMMDSDGANPAQITDAPQNERHPHFSPDGAKIVYRSNVSGNYDIWTMDSDGSDAFQLTNTSENEGHPHYSPDGSKIVFWSERTGNREVWMMNADGSGQTRLTDNPANDGGANWSPDGKKIVFRSDRAGNDDIWILNSW